MNIFLWVYFFLYIIVIFALIGVIDSGNIFADTIVIICWPIVVGVFVIAFVVGAICDFCGKENKYENW